ncbi:NAD(+) kinase [Alkalilimnicola ehrlichii MLHE-1]|uniref:NAD kinase n=1 Tax=Alkalilimnicola ehrlichii (strain ATCC BAA-1101 / DSM 17681 / MLHE-1) TaxID=187272 RepID=Q0A7E0_ALKEH|nr:NAD(+) kinase [Alkalilimnicola ehrlichii]ABI57247.1 NAD(+) kinase [Alkalilimnicola ehrlichii MLHE-1]
MNNPTPHFPVVAITGKPDDPSVTETVGSLVALLQRHGREIILDKQSTGRLGLDGLPSVDRNELGTRADLVISVGGDGTLLNTARSLVQHDIAILGVNRGRLGFLVDVSPSRLEAELEAVLSGHFVRDDRTLLQAESVGSDGVHGSGLALNDVVLHRWNTSRMIDFRTYINGELLNNHRSDGLIISTPTGSTAYAMASGGPITHPGVDAMVLVPICPHTLSNRPLVIPGNSVVEIELNETGTEHLRVSCDSQDELRLAEGDRIRIRQHPQQAHLIHPPSHGYFEILRAKLRWGDTNLR